MFTRSQKSYFYLAGDNWVPNIWASRATDELFRSAADSAPAGGGRGGRPGKSVGGLVTRDGFKPLANDGRVSSEGDAC